MPIELVVFDMAGTTVFDGDAVNASLAGALAAAGVTVTRDEVNEVMGIAKPLAIRTLMERKETEQSRVTAERVEETHNDFLNRMITYYESDPNIREVPGAASVFRQLKSAGIAVALDTGFQPANCGHDLTAAWLDGSALVDVTVTADEVARGRPFGDMIQKAMAVTGVTEPARVAKVGDTPSDLYEGKSAGCELVVGVTEGSHTRAQLEPHPHTHLIGTVAELPALILGAA